MAKRTSKADEEVIEIPDIEIGTVDETYQSALVHLFTVQGKHNLADSNPVDFLGLTMTPVQAYLNLAAIWEPEHLGPFPTLEQVCQQYWLGPPFIDRLRWYAEGAQLSENRWNPDDPDWREPEDDEGFDPAVTELADLNPTDDEIEQLTPEVEMRPQISTGDERVGPDDVTAPDATWTASGWEKELEIQAGKEWPVNEAGVKYNPQTGEIIDDDPFGVGETATSGEVVPFDDNDVDPPSWLAQGGWAGEGQMNAVKTGEKRGEPFVPQDRPEVTCITLVMRFNDELAEPRHPCDAETWREYVDALEARYRELLASKETALRETRDQIEKWRETWKSAREVMRKTWKKK